MRKRGEGGREHRSHILKSRRRQLLGARIILLVEDEVRVQRVMAEVLALSGYVVRLAATAEEALVGLDDTRVKPSLVITDVLLPGKTGRELVCTLRSRVPGIKTILVSGYGQNAACRGMEISEDVSYLPKPFSAKQLLDAVAAALALDGVAA
jgi:two-component system cell cycle sensor histidine kinase/response regulator CckA